MSRSVRDAFASGELAKLAATCSSRSELAAKLGITDKAYERQRERARAAGLAIPSFHELRAVNWSEEQTHPGAPAFDDLEERVPAGHAARGVSTLYRMADGTAPTPVLQWVKTRATEQDRYDAMLEALESLADEWRGKADPVDPQSISDDDLLCVYPMGDPHLGMYAWAAETGADFDLEIAEDHLVSAVDHLVGLAPSATEALIINLGDFFHTDNNSNRTTRSNNALDVDTRWAKVLSVGIRTMRRCIDRALERHQRVRVINEIGNHDDHSAVMLSLALAQFYEREPRVAIDTSPDQFHWHRFGRCLIGTTHGHMTKPEQLMGVMANDRAEDWGETLYRYFYCGHVHHDSLRELPGLYVETFRTLATRDKWTHGSGYRSGQDMKLDILHRKYGRINRHIVGISQIAGRR